MTCSKYSIFSKRYLWNGKYLGKQSIIRTLLRLWSAAWTILFPAKPRKWPGCSNTPPLYTSGTSAKPAGLIEKQFPVYDAGRGGEWTYHGPGQRIGYVMLDLKKRDAADVRRYVQNLEQWIIATLAHLGVEAFTREGRIGVWVNVPEGEASRPSEPSASEASRHMSASRRDSGRIITKEAKIAALGIRVRKWVTFHGISLNVNPDLSHYGGIVPCGISEFGVTSLKDLGIGASMNDVDEALKKEFERCFGTI